MNKKLDPAYLQILDTLGSNKCKHVLNLNQPAGIGNRCNRRTIVNGFCTKHAPTSQLERALLIKKLEG